MLFQSSKAFSRNLKGRDSMKKLINAVENVEDEMILGLVESAPMFVPRKKANIKLHS